MVRRVRRSRAAALARAMGGGGGRGVRPGGGWRSGIDKWGEVGRAREWESAWRRDGRRAGAEAERSWREVNRRGRLVRRLSFTNTRDFFNLLASRCSAQTMNSSSWVLLHEQRPVALELASGCEVAWPLPPRTSSTAGASDCPAPRSCLPQISTMFSPRIPLLESGGIRSDQRFRLLNLATRRPATKCYLCFPTAR